MVHTFAEGQRVQLTPKGAALLNHKFQYLRYAAVAGMGGTVTSALSNYARVKFDDLPPQTLDPHGAYLMAIGEVEPATKEVAV